MATNRTAARRVLAIGQPVLGADPNDQAIAAVSKAIDQLDNLLAGLTKMLQDADDLQSEMKINARFSRAAAEKQDQLKLLRDLQASSAAIAPMTDDAREALQSAITQLSSFVQEDQAFQSRLAFADGVI